MDWILHQARMADNEPLVDIGLAEGKIAAIAPQLSLESRQRWDLAGRVVLPGFVDAHTHLDKTYTTFQNKSGTLPEAIDVWREIKHARKKSDLTAAVWRAIETASAHGVTAMRSHVDMVTEADLETLSTLLDIRAQCRQQLKLQLVVLGDAGGTAEQQAIYRRALEMGADLAGGAPALTDNPQHSIDATLDIAIEFGKPIDLHIDETEDPNMLTLAYLAGKTIEYGLQGQVTAGHCCSLTFVDDDVAKQVIDRVARAQINIITLPSCNLVLMGRGLSPPPRGITRVKQLLAAGVNVCAASDNVQDPFNPFGAYDLLHIANLNAHVTHLSGEAEILTSLAMVTTKAAQTMGLPAYGLSKNSPADLVVLDATRVLDAVTSLPPRLATFKAGQRIVHTVIERTYMSQE